MLWNVSMKSQKANLRLICEFSSFIIPRMHFIETLMHLKDLRGLDGLSGKLFCFPVEKGSTLKGKNLIP